MNLDAQQAAKLIEKAAVEYIRVYGKEYQSDADDLRDVAEQLKKGNVKSAWSRANDLDTIVREAIPQKAWDFMELTVKGRVSSSAERILAVAKDVLAGHSYAVESLSVRLSGWQPFNVDTIRDINRIWFPYVDDEGNRQDDGSFHITDHKRLTGPMTYQQEKLMKQQGKAPETEIRGTIPANSRDAAVAALAKAMKKFGLKVEAL